MKIQNFKKIGCTSDLQSQKALNAHREIIKHYNLVDGLTQPLDDCDVIIVLGGDGMMLKAMHKYMDSGIPMFGMNLGSIGFLLNEYKPDGLFDRLNNALVTEMHPLEMIAVTQSGQKHVALAINEISLLRETNQTAQIRISVDDETRLESLTADGIILATPAGSSAYNFAAYGPIIPLGSNILALTPICPFRPRRWRGALLSQKARLDLTFLNPTKKTCERRC